MPKKQDWITPEEFRKTFVTGGALLYGDEDYLKKTDVDRLRKNTVDENDVFNCYRINADSYSPDGLLSAIESLPVMAERKFIELYDMRLGKVRADDGFLTNLCDILSHVQDSPDTLLVFVIAAGELDDKPKHLAALKKVLTPVFYDRLPPNRLWNWIARHFSAEGVFADGNVCRLLADISGTDMYTLAGEISKISALTLASGRDHVSEQDVRSAAGRNLDYDEFSFTDALLRRDSQHALDILADLKLKKEKPEKILSGINSTLCNIYTALQLSGPGVSYDMVAEKMRVHPYRAKIFCRAAAGTDEKRLSELIGVCHRSDLLIKNSALSAYTVLERLTAEALGR